MVQSDSKNMVEMVPHIALSVEAAGQICAGGLCLVITGGGLWIARKISISNNGFTTMSREEVAKSEYLYQSGDMKHGSQETFLKEVKPGIYVNMPNGGRYVKVARAPEQKWRNPVITLEAVKGSVKQGLEDGNLQYDPRGFVYRQIDFPQGVKNPGCEDVDFSSYGSSLKFKQASNDRIYNAGLLREAKEIKDVEIARLQRELNHGQTLVSGAGPRVSMRRDGERRMRYADEQAKKVEEKWEEVKEEFKKSEERICHPDGSPVYGVNTESAQPKSDDPVSDAAWEHNMNVRIK